MSIQAVAAVLDTDVGEVAAKMLLVCIANAHNSSTGICCPSLDRLAVESSMGRSTVKRWLKWLQDHNFIKRQDRWDETGRQQSPSFLLTLTEGSKLDPSLPADPQDVGGPSSDHREATSEPDEGSTAEPPLKKPEEQPFSPQPPSGGLSFASLWEKWPIAHRGQRENAEGAYAKLSPAERETAASAADVVVSALARRKERIPALVSYLRSRVFVEFDSAPPIDAEGYFIIKPGRPEWSAWLGDIRNSSFGERGVENTVKLGFMLRKQRWPAGHPQALVAA